MARALSSVKMAAALISNQLSRRRFAAVAQGTEASRRNVMAPKKPAEKEPAPWIPDPVSGYYRPENSASPIDVAELREVLLKQSKNSKN